MKSSKRISGFTMVEILIVLATTVPILIVIGSASRVAIGSFKASEQAATTTQVVLKAVSETERALRFGGRESLRTPATSNDVRLRRATSVGQWIALPAGEPRTSIQVTSLVGEDGAALLLPKRLHTLEFVPDPADAQDALDNDRDGMVDEGSLRLTRGDDSLVLAKDLELCTFVRSGHTVTITLRCVRPGHGRKLQRTTLRQTVFLINP